MNVAAGLERRFGSEKYRGLTKRVNGNDVWTGEVRLDEAALLQPLKWKKGRRIFVNSMSDLFHESLSDEQIDRVFAVMALAPQHTFQVLTKRSDRMRVALGRIGSSIDYLERHARAMGRSLQWSVPNDLPSPLAGKTVGLVSWPLPNVWLGVSAERQEEADERIPDLLATPAAVRFVSLEPLLGPIDLNAVNRAGIVQGRNALRDTGSGALGWVIVGGESGKGARRMHERWAREIRDQCAASGVPFLFKQWGEHDPETFDRVGKKAAGRLLEGVEHNSFPGA